MLRAAFLLALVFPLAGCSGPEPIPSMPTAPEPPGLVAPERQVLLHVDAWTQQFDVMCVFGGGVKMPRETGRVLPGTSHIEASVTVNGTSTGLQLGYVVDESPGNDEWSQEGIVWLEPVVTAGVRHYIIPVWEDQYERPDGLMLWHFYQRMNVPTGEEGLQAPCYTGYHDAVMVLHAEAVPASAA